MKKTIACLCLGLFWLQWSHALEVRSLLSRVTDASFGGYYLDVEKTIRTLNISRFEAYEIQNQMRDELEVNSGSFSRVEQKPFVETALSNAIDSVVNRKSYQSGFTPLRFKENEFVVALDLDETLLTHWYRYATKKGEQRKGSLFITVRDSVVRSTDRKTGNSLKDVNVLLSANTVQLRPDVESFIKRVSKLPNFKGFILFTAKEDKSAWDVYQTWKQARPELFRKVLGFFTRNYLLFDGSVKKPSKDLRIFDPTLKHIVLLDDNEGRVLQKELNFRIPKFNADGYLEAVRQKNTNLISLHANVLNFAAERVIDCAQKKNSGSFSQCIQNRLGHLSQTQDKEIQEYLNWATSQKLVKGLSLQEVLDNHVFHQDFVFAFKRKLREPFPKFKNGRMLK